LAQCGSSEPKHGLVACLEPNLAPKYFSSPPCFNLSSPDEAQMQQ